ncbi:MAG: Uma2 family endonuclease [Alphaproteobacteria bacterium]|nr:Uma2 family endonuclease [Alphaproteobacteria bacterium]
MSHPAPAVLPTLEDFLAYEADSDIKHEFVDGEAWAMSGARRNHELVAGALFATIWNHLHDHPCEVHKGDMLVRVDAADAAFYPDVVVTCDPRDHEDPDALFIRHPCLVAEVLSPSTAQWDQGGKFERYSKLESLKEYAVLHSDEARVTVLRRTPEGEWRRHTFGAGETLWLESVTLSLPIDALYGGIKLAPRRGRAEG